MGPGSRKQWTDADDNRLLRMYSDGYPRSVIAEALGRSGGAITKRKQQLEQACSTI